MNEFPASGIVTFNREVGIDRVGEVMASIAHQVGCTQEELLAKCISWEISRRTPLSRLLQFSIDTASDQYLAEEFYQRHPELMLFLSISGSDNEELLFRSYIAKHQEILHCRTTGCNGRLVGGCPKMACEECGRLYYISVDKLSALMCKRCTAKLLGECTKESVSKIFKIFAVMDTRVSCVSGGDDGV